MQSLETTPSCFSRREEFLSRFSSPFFLFVLSFALLLPRSAGDIRGSLLRREIIDNVYISSPRRSMSWKLRVTFSRRCAIVFSINIEADVSTLTYALRRIAILTRDFSRIFASYHFIRFPCKQRYTRLRLSVTEIPERKLPARSAIYGKEVSRLNR